MEVIRCEKLKNDEGQFTAYQMTVPAEIILKKGLRVEMRLTSDHQRAKISFLDEENIDTSPPGGDNVDTSTRAEILDRLLFGDISLSDIERISNPNEEDEDIEGDFLRRHRQVTHVNDSNVNDIATQTVGCLCRKRKINHPISVVRPSQRRRVSNLPRDIDIGTTQDQPIDLTTEVEIITIDDNDSGRSSDNEQAFSDQASDLMEFSDSDDESEDLIYTGTTHDQVMSLQEPIQIDDEQTTTRGSLPQSQQPLQTSQAQEDRSIHLTGPEENLSDDI